MKKTYCDLCEKFIGEGGGFFDINQLSHGSFSMDWRKLKGGKLKADEKRFWEFEELCAGCYKKLEKVITKWVEENEE